MDTFIVKWELTVKAASHVDAAKAAHRALCLSGPPMTYHVRIPHQRGKAIHLEQGSGK